MSELFTVFAKVQGASDCGPTSLAYCLNLLGISADRKVVAKRAGTTYWGGTDEKGLKRAARAFRAKTTELQFSEKREGAAFAKRLRAHVERGLPAVLLVLDGAHWISVLGVDGSGRFIIDDPSGEELFSFWSDRTLLSNTWVDTDEDSYYYAILVERADEAPAAWTLTPDFIRLALRGSGDTAEGMVDTLLAVAAGAGLRTGRASGGARPLAEVLRSIEDEVVESAWGWTGYEGSATKASVRRQYRDYVVVAEASGLVVPREVETTALACRMTAVLCAFIWNDEDLG